MRSYINHNTRTSTFQRGVLSYLSIPLVVSTTKVFCILMPFCRYSTSKISVSLFESPCMYSLASEGSLFASLKFVLTFVLVLKPCYFILAKSCCFPRIQSLTSALSPFHASCPMASGSLSIPSVRAVERKRPPVPGIVPRL